MRLLGFLLNKTLLLSFIRISIFEVIYLVEALQFYFKSDSVLNHFNHKNVSKNTTNLQATLSTPINVQFHPDLFGGPIYA